MLVTCLDCAERDEEALRDRLAGATLGHQLQHLALARRRSSIGSSRRWRPTSSLTTVVERRSALGDAAHRAGELRDVSDAVLEQVAEALRALGEELHRVGGLDELERTRDADPSCWSRIFAATSPLVGLGRRHADVDHGDVGLVHRDVTEQILRHVSDWATTRTPPSSSRAIPSRSTGRPRARRVAGWRPGGAQGREVAAEPGLVELEDPLRLRVCPAGARDRGPGRCGGA